VTTFHTRVRVALGHHNEYEATNGRWPDFRIRAPISSVVRPVSGSDIPQRWQTLLLISPFESFWDLYGTIRATTIQRFRAVHISTDFFSR